MDEVLIERPEPFDFDMFCIHKDHQIQSKMFLDFGPHNYGFQFILINYTFHALIGHQWNFWVGGIWNKSNQLKKLKKELRIFFFLLFDLNFYSWLIMWINHLIYQMLITHEIIFVLESRAFCSYWVSKNLKMGYYKSKFPVLCFFG